MIPPAKKDYSRKDEITADFLKLMDEHVKKLLNEEVTSRHSASYFAGLLFINSRHLTNTIKQTTGKSPCDFMEERLMLEAENLLSTTDLPIAKIGYKLGYSEPTNFTKFFKGMCGITPLQYRKQQNTKS